MCRFQTNRGTRGAWAYDRSGREGNNRDASRQHLDIQVLDSNGHLPSLLLLPGAATQAQQALVANPTQKMRPVTDEMLLDPDPSDWLMWRRTYNGWGYSPLDQINKDNVKDLGSPGGGR